ncbi:MAG: hypothetical protein IPK76_22645 [Lewinellaceae bacterium]|nr:hypothetical protein [Lewinellaceae bacterium]
MTLYYGIPEGLSDSGGDRFGEETLAELAPNQPPIVNAGADQTVGLDGPSVSAELDATVIDDRLEKTEALFVTWEKVDGAGDVTFDDPHAVRTNARFTRRGRYVLRITAHDGMLSASDELIVVVNERPVVSAGPDQEILARRDAAGNLVLEAALFGEIADDGRGDPNGSLTATWTGNQPRRHAGCPGIYRRRPAPAPAGGDIPQPRPLPAETHRTERFLHCRRRGCHTGGRPREESAAGTLYL